MEDLNEYSRGDKLEIGNEYVCEILETSWVRRCRSKSAALPEGALLLQIGQLFLNGVLAPTSVKMIEEVLGTTYFTLIVGEKYNLRFLGQIRDCSYFELVDNTIRVSYISEIFLPMKIRATAEVNSEV